VVALLALCTDLGPMVGSRGEDGVIVARIAGRLSARGTADHLQVWAGATAIYRGPLADLHPTEDAASAPTTHAGIIEHLRIAQSTLSCSAGGAHHVRVGLWPDAVPIGSGQRPVWSSGEQVRLRSPSGQATTFLALPMDRELAGSIAAELATLPQRSGVSWKGGIGLIAWSEDPEQPLPNTVLPRATAGPRVVPLLRMDEVPPSPPRPAHGALLAGAEAAAWINELRATAGLSALAWDDPLALAALQHAAYVRVTDRQPVRHTQDPASPLFLGEDPVDRGGATEVLLTSHPPLTPKDAVAHWVGAPYHRVPVLHPNAQRIGVANLGGVWVAEIAIADGSTAMSWPPDGATITDVAFEGREVPDPLPLAHFPDRLWPVGSPITIWTTDRTKESEVRQDGTVVPHFVVRSALGSPDTAKHLIPKARLRRGSTITWTARTESWDGQSTEWSGSFTTTPQDPNLSTKLPSAIEALVDQANARRAHPLRTTARAAGLARLMSARTLAIAEGLPATSVRDVLAPILGQGADSVKLCIRPDDHFNLDEAFLDPSLNELAYNPRGATITWRSNPHPQAHVAHPRSCIFLFRPGP